MAVLHVDIDTFEHRYIGFGWIVELDVLDIDSALLNAAE